MTLRIINNKYLDLVNDFNDQQSEWEKIKKTHILTSQSIHRSHLWWQASGIRHHFQEKMLKRDILKAIWNRPKFIIGSKIKVNVNNMFKCTMNDEYPALFTSWKMIQSANKFMNVKLTYVRILRTTYIILCVCVCVLWLMTSTSSYFYSSFFYIPVFFFFFFLLCDLLHARLSIG